MVLDQEEYSLENLKKFTISKKLLEIHSMHFTTYVSCLLPHPPPYARVGGQWLVSRNFSPLYYEYKSIRLATCYVTGKCWFRIRLI